MNIILNSYCNLKCNYCFADEYMEEHVQTPSKSMDFQFFQEELLPRVKNVSLINFMGGEPTLHPRFTDILSETLESMLHFTYLATLPGSVVPSAVVIGMPSWMIASPRKPNRGCGARMLSPMPPERP